ncbi:3-ketoacyl-ACP reductase [Marinilongibacter aquaticus]|uniref:3-ketoacyl-ACP reductase n=1 Tax=Marinilongibacter aquaticus TaxID=2975157 RepID=UPI0021BDB1B5|nr:3-ketoacyl-ACP reductase [Marinilongibacter aquaticus]UBM58958.1 3-ketoacyl-ACP reductase [Marinilongibacter aquaticus]
MRKTALVTGGSRGIGLGIAKALATSGYDVAINGTRPETDVHAALEELSQFEVEVLYCQGNIAKSEDRKVMLEKIEQKWGQLNVLVNNAGVAPRQRKDILDLEEDDFDYMMQINQKGTFFLSQQAARWMIEQKQKQSDYEACIVNITSISATVASINRAEYCMAKASLSMMSKLMSVRMSESNIPVYEIQPGLIETDMTAKVKGKYTAMAEEGLVLEKRMGKPEDIGKIVAALATGQIPYSTGQTIIADGGMGIARL